MLIYLDLKDSPGLHLFRLLRQGWHIAWDNSPFECRITVIYGDISEHQEHVLQGHPKSSRRGISSKWANLLLGLLRPKVTEWVPIAFPLFSSAVFVRWVSNKKDQVSVSIRQSDWPSIQNGICVVVLYSFPIYCSPSE